MPDYYPVYLNLAGKRCVILGGGTVAQGKIAALRQAGANITVISPDATSGIQRAAQRGDVECFNRPRVEAADDDRQRLAPTDANPRSTAELIGGELGRHGRDGVQAVVALPLRLGNQHAAETECAR